MMKNYINKYLLVTCISAVLTLSNVGCSNIPKQNETISKQTIKEEKTSSAEFIALAKSEESNKQFKKSLLYYIQALELDENNVDILCEIGYLQLKLQSPDLAIRAFEHAITIKPDHIPALAQIGIYYLENKNMPKAKKFLERTILLDQQRLHNSNVKELVSLDQHSPLMAYNVLAVANDLDNRHDYARQIFTLLLKTEKNRPMIYTNLGYSYYLTNSYALAQSQYQKALDVDPSFKRAKLNLGLIYVRNGQYNKAVQLLKQVMTHAQAYNDIGYFLLLNGRYKEAEYFLQSAIDLSPSYYEIGNINLENAQLHKREHSF